MNTHIIRKEHSMIAEAIGIVHALVSQLSNKDMIPDTLKALSQGSESIEFLTNEPNLSFIMLELLLFVEERHDIELFFDEYNDLSQDKLIYCLLAGQFKIETLNEGSTEDFLLYSEKIDVIDSKLYNHYIKNPRSFFDPLIKIVIEIFNHESFKAIFDDEITGIIKNHYAILSDELNHRHPLSYAQSIMAKSFYNISDWSTYEFLYLYAIYPYKARLMDDDQNIMLISIFQRQWLNDEHINSMQKQMKLIADPSRMKMLRLIYSNPMYGKELAEKLNLTTATVSHHLEQMRLEGLVHVERNKNTKYYSTNQANLNKLLINTKKYISHQ